MRIHIVCRNPDSDLIVPRLARILLDGTGWTIGPAPDPTADLNHYSLYLEQLEQPGFDATPTSAWFTHRDTYQRGKVELWDRVAGAVDLRLTSIKANLAGLRKYGPTTLVTPALDREKFKPGPVKPRPDMLVVGTSGRVYQGGRKGEQLLKRLTLSEPGRRCHWISAGTGWPIANVTDWAWSKIEKFYQSLDLYVCTSLLEGVGYGPLEALACGVPVIIPAGVGIFDDLTQEAGIWRYLVGNPDDLQNTLRDAISSLSGQVKPESTRLRAVTGPFTPQAWRVDHERAFRILLKPTWSVALPARERLPDWRNKSGAYFVAYGGPARKVAKLAVTSFKRQMKGVPVAVVSDRRLNAGEDLYLERPDLDIGGRTAKLDIYDLSPKDWHYVLYLDADTETIADISFLFQVLADGWELAICKNPADFHLLSRMVRPDNKDESLITFEALGTDQALQLNGGVFAFRRCGRVKRFFKLWREEWQCWAQRDQAALHRALWRMPLRTYVLGSEWNTVTRYDPPERSAGILHRPMTARRWTGRIEGRLDSPEAWAAVRQNESLRKHRIPA